MPESAGKWIYSQEHKKYYRQEFINGNWVTTWEGDQNVAARPDSVIGPGTYAPSSEPSSSQNYAYSFRDVTPTPATASVQYKYNSPTAPTQPPVQYTTHPGNYGANDPYSNKPNFMYTTTAPPQQSYDNNSTFAQYGSQSGWTNPQALPQYIGHGYSQGNDRGVGPTVEGTWEKEPGALNYEQLDFSYFVRPRSFFVPGRMFSILFTEPAGSTAVTSYNNDSISMVKFGEHAFSQIRRFIVVRSRIEFCFACPVFTYSGRATTKNGIRPHEHAVVHSDNRQPQLLDGEIGITKDPIMVSRAPDVRELDPCSRIYFGIHHPIQYNVKVKDLGMVCPNDVPKVIGYWQEESLQGTSFSGSTQQAH